LTDGAGARVMIFNRIHADLTDGGKQLCQLSDYKFMSKPSANQLYLQCPPGYSASINVFGKSDKSKLGDVTYTLPDGRNYTFATNLTLHDEEHKHTQRTAKKFGC
jgi:hypothetical protein